MLNASDDLKLYLIRLDKFDKSALSSAEALMVLMVLVRLSL